MIADAKWYCQDVKDAQKMHKCLKLNYVFISLLTCLLLANISFIVCTHKTLFVV